MMNMTDGRGGHEAVTRVKQLEAVRKEKEMEGAGDGGRRRWAKKEMGEEGDGRRRRWRKRSWSWREEEMVTCYCKFSIRLLTVWMLL